MLFSCRSPFLHVHRCARQGYGLHTILGPSVYPSLPSDCWWFGPFLLPPFGRLQQRMGTTDGGPHLPSKPPRRWYPPVLTDYNVRAGVCCCYPPWAECKLSWDKLVLLKVSSARITLCSRWKTKQKNRPRTFKRGGGLILKKVDPFWGVTHVYSKARRTLSRLWETALVKTGWRLMKTGWRLEFPLVSGDYRILNMFDLQFQPVADCRLLKVFTVCGRKKQSVFYEIYL